MVLGAGGTIARLDAAGDDVHVLIVTEGTTQQYDDEALIEAKRESAEQAADALGVKSLRFGNLPDMRLDDIPHVEVNAVIEAAVDEFEPETVFTHSGFDVNIDHTAVCESTLVATRPASGVKEVMSYAIPSAADWTGGGSSPVHPHDVRRY